MALKNHGCYQGHPTSGHKFQISQEFAVDMYRRTIPAKLKNFVILKYADDILMELSDHPDEQVIQMALINVCFKTFGLSFNGDKEVIIENNTVIQKTEQNSKFTKYLGAFIDPDHVEKGVKKLFEEKLSDVRYIGN